MARGRYSGDFTRHFSGPGRRYGYVAKEPVDMKFSQRRPRLSEGDPFKKDATRAGLDAAPLDMSPEAPKSPRGNRRVKKDPDAIEGEEEL